MYVFNPFTGTLDWTAAGGSSGINIGDPVGGSTQGSVLFINGGNLSEDAGVFNYDFNDESFQAALGTYLSTWRSVNDSNGQGGSNSFLACGGDIVVTTDNFTGGSGATTRIASGGRATGSSDFSGTPAAGGNAGNTYISVGGSSDVYQGCSTGAQGNGGYVFIACGGASADDSGIGVAGLVQIGGCVDSIGSGTGTTSGTFNCLAAASFYSGVNFFSSVFATAFEIGTLTVDTAINFVDATNAANLPVQLIMNRSLAANGEYVAQITFGASAYNPNALNFGQVYGDYNQGFTYFSYPNQFGGVGGFANPVLAFVPASVASVAGHIYNHAGINCIPTDADLDLQFNPASYGMGRQRNAVGSGADLSDWVIWAGSPSVSQTNVKGGNLILRGGLTTGNRFSDVILQGYAAGASGSSDNSSVEVFRGSPSTGLTSNYSFSKYNNLTTAGQGVAPILGNGRFTAKTAAQTVSTTAVGAADASFEISANVLVTTATVHNFTVTCSYTDEGNTARTLTLTFSNLAGTLLTAIANAAGAIPYEGIPLHIRCKAGTNIVIASVGTFTTVTYNIESVVKRTV